ncbi:MAG TPA: dioxygenase [Rhizobiaceae bacterium]|nr:dioxygenase [Rhizobiaceae bacterium]
MTARSFEANSAEIVASRLGREDALSAFLIRLVEHLHTLVKEMQPTRDEWREAIRFLTEVGHASDERRQEWILLSDLLGVSALVEAINAPRPNGGTPNTSRGPFYRPDAPRYPPGASISLDGVGVPLEVTGQVVDLDGRPIGGAAIETWQANSEGLYENQEPDRQPDFNLRGRFAADAEGRFRYRTVKPAGYSVPAGGPAGDLFRRAGAPLHRPAHIHFIVRADGFETITTQIYDSADPRLDEDAIFGVRDQLAADFRPKDSDGTEWALDYVFVMVRSRRRSRAA